MRKRRCGLLIVSVVLFFSRTAYADSLLAWEFTGTLAQASRVPAVADQYPVGTPFDLQVTFDPAAPSFFWDAGTQRGLFGGIISATLQLGDNEFAASHGVIAVNCWYDPGCDRAIPGMIEFEITH